MKFEILLKNQHASRHKNISPNSFKNTQNTHKISFRFLFMIKSHPYSIWVSPPYCTYINSKHDQPPLLFSVAFFLPIPPPTTLFSSLPFLPLPYHHHVVYTSLLGLPGTQRVGKEGGEGVDSWRFGVCILRPPPPLMHVIILLLPRGLGSRRPLGSVYRFSVLRSLSRWSRNYLGPGARSGADNKFK